MIYPIAVLALACLGLGYGVFAFAHGRLIGIDVAEWERLHASGLLERNNSLAQDFRTVTYLLHTISRVFHGLAGLAERGRVGATAATRAAAAGCVSSSAVPPGLRPHGASCR
jgi:hypothetical protein